MTGCSGGRDWGVRGGGEGGGGGSRGYIYEGHIYEGRSGETVQTNCPVITPNLFIRLSARSLAGTPRRFFQRKTDARAKTTGCS